MRDIASPSEITVRAQAARESESQELNARFLAVETAAVTEFGDRWDQAVRDLSMLNDGTSIPREILQAALEVEEPARTLLELSKDLERADQLMALSPIQRAIAINRLAPPAVRDHRRPRSPVPIVDANSGSERPSDRDSDEEWNRKEEIRERRARDQRRGGMR
ncbi:hypothetical protein CV770_26685 [Bradyrhizobium sp. AC87j1]|uniref:hypothetical protein n=1 Tax=Bradyrhizobium sp. AC87j1 TaxID=2055894 RepID=UPI000CEBC39F|nr:hypothetical protein [Bradyrhizobium sp. AC87j1]PPQ16335.1 hypothetical protein CV770_26685 [Bradyrhizobium sp. AC87j1]